MHRIVVELIEGYPQPRSMATKKAMQLYTDGKLIIRKRDIFSWHTLDWLIGEIFGIYPYIHTFEEHSYGVYTVLVAQGRVMKSGEHRDYPLCKIKIRITDDNVRHYD